MATLRESAPPSGRYNRPLSAQMSEVGRQPIKAKIIRAKSMAANSAASEKRVNFNCRRNDSLIVLEELVECGICLRRLKNPKMLHCQHTFCYDCLKQLQDSTTEKEIQCPICLQRSEIGIIDDLPSNIYINNLISVLNTENTNVETKSEEPCIKKKEICSKSCVRCKTICQDLVVCQHCKMGFCAVCFPQHAEELTQQFPDFLKQLNEHEMRLKFEEEDFRKHCLLLTNEIQLAIETKINELRKLEDAIVQDVKTIHETGNMEIEDISGKIRLLKNEISQQGDTKPHSKVMHYMGYHQQISKIMDTITNLSSNYKHFNLETFKLDAPISPSPIPTGFIYDEIPSSQITSPTMLLSYYKNKHFQPQSAFQKLQKPTGVCASPWNKSQIFVCNLKLVYIYDVKLNKIIDRISYEGMTCPQGIACSFATNQIFVSDKWKNCIHVFSHEGEYLRSLSPKNVSNPHGIALTSNEELLLCDAGNNRVLIIDSTNGRIKNSVGVEDNKTELSMPTDIATNGKIIVVADMGNNRIKIFDASTLKRINVIGSFGKLKGQFKSPEVVHIDQAGNILVGDSGNRRLQIFNCQGDFVQCTSTEYKFHWISGICTNENSDIIVTDYKSKILIRF